LRQALKIGINGSHRHASIGTSFGLAVRRAAAELRVDLSSRPRTIWAITALAELEQREPIAFDKYCYVSAGTIWEIAIKVGLRKLVSLLPLLYYNSAHLPSPSANSFNCILCLF
jgi:hypothetical protein